MSTDKSGDIRFEGRVAIVTGAGSGLGQAYALLLGQRGAKIVVNDLSPETAETTAKAIRDGGGTAVTCAGSVTQRQTAEKIVQTAVDSFGTVDILVNNAGTGLFRQFHECEDELFHKLMALNVYGSWAVTQEAWRHMQKQKYGRIIMVASSAMLGQPHSEAYGATKGAVFGLMRCLAVDGEQYGIQVNALTPAAFTPNVPREVKDPALAGFMEKYMPVSSVAPVPIWLSHEDCKITGESITAFGPSFSKYFVGQTCGYTAAADKHGPETVRDHFEECCEQDGYSVPKSTQESFLLGASRLGADAGIDFEAAFRR